MKARALQVFVWMQIALAGLGSFGCQAPDPAPEAQQGSAAAALVEGEPLAVGMIQFLNHPSTTLALLDDDVPLDRRAAENLVAHRNGPDGILGTGDDDLFGSVAEIDAVSYVGPAALQNIATYATAHGWVPGGYELLGVYDGVSFSADEAAATLALVNAAGESVLDFDVPLDHRAVESILDARPIATVLELSTLYYVGASALLALRAYATANTSGAAGDDCASTADCVAGLSCVGKPFDGSPPIGKCADTTTPHPGDGDLCSAAAPCGAGLLCTGTTVYDGQGFCRPPWMWGTYQSVTDVPIPDASSAGITSSIVVYGLATVPEDIVVTLDIDHPRPQDLVVTLHAANGSSAVLWQNETSPSAVVIAVEGIERDNFVNGTWTLQVVDNAGGQAGTLRGFTLEVNSRYD